MKEVSHFLRQHCLHQVNGYNLSLCSFQSHWHPRVSVLDAAKLRLSRETSKYFADKFHRAATFCKSGSMYANMELHSKFA